MQVTDFNRPTHHPFEMLANYRNASEKESTLAWMLVDCIEANDLELKIETKHSHPAMVEDGLLEEVGERTYKLTKKSLGLLYSVYGK